MENVQQPDKGAMDNIDEETKSTLETYIAQIPAQMANLWQTAEDVANVVDLELTLHKYQLKWQTCGRQLKM